MFRSRWHFLRHSLAVASNSVEPVFGHPIDQRPAVRRSPRLRTFKRAHVFHLSRTIIVRLCKKWMVSWHVQISLTFSAWSLQASSSRTAAFHIARHWPRSHASSRRSQPGRLCACCQSGFDCWSRRKKWGKIKDQLRSCAKQTLFFITLLSNLRYCANIVFVCNLRSRAISDSYVKKYR